MAYQRNNLISRPGYSGFGDIWDTLTGAAGGVLKVYGASQQAQGAAAASNADLQAALAAQQGPGMGTILLLGALGVGAFLLLRKKS